MKKSTLIIIAMITAAFAQEQTATATHNLSLQDVLTRAINNNPLVRAEQINTDIAAAIVREYQSSFGSRFRADYRISDSERQSFDESHNLSATITKDFSTGTSVEGTIGASPGTRDTITREMTFQNTVGITVTQALLQGLGTTVNLVPLRKAEIDQDMRREELAAYALRLIADVERAYWDLLVSGEQMEIYEYSLELAERLLYESEERLRIGGIAPVDLIAIHAEVASRRRQLFDAQVSYRQKALYLLYLINATDMFDREIVLTDSLNNIDEAIGADPVSDHIEAAKKFRTDYILANMQAQKGELDLIQTRNGLLPRLDFFISLTGNSPNETFAGAILPNDDISRTIAAGLTLQFPIRNVAARERHRRQVYSIEQQRLSVENYGRLIDYEVFSAHMEVERAQQQIATAREVSALQLQKLEAEEAKLSAGKSTGYAVLQVQRDVVSAHLDESQAKLAYVNALLTLYSRDGTLLMRRGVEF